MPYVLGVVNWPPTFSSAAGVLKMTRFTAGVEVAEGPRSTSMRSRSKPGSGAWFTRSAALDRFCAFGNAFVNAKVGSSGYHRD